MSKIILGLLKSKQKRQSSSGGKKKKRTNNKKLLVEKVTQIVKNQVKMCLILLVIRNID